MRELHNNYNTIIKICNDLQNNKHYQDKEIIMITCFEELHYYYGEIIIITCMGELYHNYIIK